MFVLFVLLKRFNFASDNTEARMEPSRYSWKWQNDEKLCIWTEYEFYYFQQFYKATKQLLKLSQADAPIFETETTRVTKNWRQHQLHYSKYLIFLEVISSCNVKTKRGIKILSMEIFRFLLLFPRNWNLRIKLFAQFEITKVR